MSAAAAQLAKIAPTMWIARAVLALLLVAPYTLIATVAPALGRSERTS